MTLPDVAVFATSNFFLEKCQIQASIYIQNEVSTIGLEFPDQKLLSFCQ